MLALRLFTDESEGGETRAVLVIPPSTETRTVTIYPRRNNCDIGIDAPREIEIDREGERYE